jgi:hypothetical protein
MYLNLGHGLFSELYDRRGASEADQYKIDTYFSLGMPNRLIGALHPFSSSGWAPNSAIRGSDLGEKFDEIVSFPCKPLNQDNEYLTEASGLITSNKCNLYALTLGGIGDNGGLMLLSSARVRIISEDTNLWHTAFLANMITVFQSTNKIKVNGYYGGVSKAYLVTINPVSKTIVDISEVPAEE